MINQHPQCYILSFVKVSLLVPEKWFNISWAWRSSWSCDLDHLYNKRLTMVDNRRWTTDKLTDDRWTPYYNRLTRAQVSYNIRITCPCNMSRVMRKPESCIYVKNKGALFSLQKYNNSSSTYIQASGLLL